MSHLGAPMSVCGPSTYVEESKITASNDVIQDCVITPSSFVNCFISINYSADTNDSNSSLNDG